MREAPHLSWGAGSGPLADLLTLGHCSPYLPCFLSPSSFLSFPGSGTIPPPHHCLFNGGGSKHKILGESQKSASLRKWQGESCGFLEEGCQAEGTASADPRWICGRWADGQIQQVPEVSGVHPSNGKSSPRQVALCHPGGWVQSQAYPRALLRPLKVGKKGTWKGPLIGRRGSPSFASARSLCSCSTRLCRWTRSLSASLKRLLKLATWMLELS